MGTLYQRALLWKAKGEVAPGEVKDERRNIIEVLRVLGKEMQLENCLKVLGATGHFPLLLSSPEGFCVTEKVDEAEVLSNGSVHAFAIVYPEGKWFDTPNEAMEHYISNLNDD